MDGMDMADRRFLWNYRGHTDHFYDPCDQIPRGARNGVLGIETTRGDRLFITLLGSAFINLAWVGMLSAPQWGALVVCFFYAIAVFRWV